MSTNEFKVAALIPTRGRTKPLEKSIKSLIEQAEHPDTIQILIAFDNDDVKIIKYFQQAIQPWMDDNNVNYTVLSMDRLGYQNLNLYYNKLAEYSNSDWLMGWGDDSIMETKGWDTKIAQHDGEFKLLKVHTHNEHPYSIFPILPRKWFEILGHISQHSSNDAYVSQLAYYLDIFERIEVYCAHNRFDVTGINNDATYQQREIMEGNPDRPGDLNHPDEVKLRTSDAAKLATWMQDQGLDLTFFIEAWEGRQDPWGKMRANDTNNQVDATARRVNTT
jgi:hypothetical protein